MTEIDLFGIKSGSKSSNKYSFKVVQYIISKKDLLDSLGFDINDVTFIQYDNVKNVLIIKTEV